MTDPAFDARFAELGPVEPPEAVAARTVAAYRMQRQREALRTRVIAALGMVAMAALTLFAVQLPDEVGSPEAMVERGAGERSPVVDLRLAVRSKHGEITRFERGRSYAAGDTLLFRVHSPTPTTLTLQRNGEAVWSGVVPAGESDLPVGYTLEAGQSAAYFQIVGSGEPLGVSVPAVSP